MEYYVFKKSGFKNRQSDKLKDANTRKFIFWARDANNDPKMMALHAQRDHSLLPMFIEILSNLDLETETWEVSKLHFDLWAQRTFGNNRFNVLKRLRWLSDNGFIELCEYSDKPLQDVTKPLSNISQEPSKELANSLQDTSKDLPKGVREDENPHHSTRDLEKKEKRREEGEEEPSPSPSGYKVFLKDCRFLQLNIRGDSLSEDEWAFRCILEERRNKKQNSMGCDTPDKLLTLYPTYLDRWKRWFLKPIDQRVAAIVYTYLKKQPDEPFKYALAMLEKHPDAIEQYRKRAKESLDLNDLEVNIS